MHEEHLWFLTSFFWRQLTLYASFGEKLKGEMYNQGVNYTPPGRKNGSFRPKAGMALCLSPLALGQHSPPAAPLSWLLIASSVSVCCRSLASPLNTVTPSPLWALFEHRYLFERLSFVFRELWTVHLPFITAKLYFDVLMCRNRLFTAQHPPLALWTIIR